MKFIENGYKFNFAGFENDVYKFNFRSVGAYKINKVVTIAPFQDDENIYILGFGNEEIDENGELFINDMSEVNNSDFKEVLATVFNCVMYFLYLRPNLSVLFFGNTIHKNELYKRKIAQRYNELSQGYSITGGRIKNDIPIIRKVHETDGNNKIKKRTIYYKDIGSITGQIETEYTEPFDIKDNKKYQFIIIQVK